MRNLRHSRFDVWRSPEDFAVRSITAAAWDASTESAVVAYGPSENDTLVELVRASRTGAKE
jgi:elongator complex protein 1